MVLLAWLRDIALDGRFAVRLLAKDARFTLAAIAAIALGIAANTTVFTFIDAALFRDLPFDRPDRVVEVRTLDRRGQPRPLSYLDLRDWQAATRAFSGLSASANALFNLSEERRAPERVTGAYISANTFRLLGRDAILGRALTPEDERPGAPAVVLLGYDVWRSRYGGDSSVVGRTIRVNGTPAVIVGVMPSRFRFPGISDAWQPLSAFPGVAARRDARTLSVVGRLGDGVTLPQARADLESIAARLAREYPETNAGIGATVSPMLEAIRRGTRGPLMTLMGAVVFVLLIACANVANLLLARAAARSREIAIRSSLGATRWRIVRQLLIESGILAASAGAIGLVLSIYGTRYFGVAFDAYEIGGDRLVTPYWVNLSMNGPIFAFVALLCLGSTVAFGLVPALHVSKTNVNDALKDSGAGTSGSLRARRWSAALIVGELALTVILLAAAGLMVRSFVRLYRTDLVIDPAGLVTARFALPAQKYAAPEQRRAFVDRLEERLRADRQIAAAALTSDVPLASAGSAIQLAIDGRSPVPGETPPTVSIISASDAYFETLGLRALSGRVLARTDAEPGHESVVVNERFATMFLADGPLGRRLQLTASGPGAVSTPWLTVVGVVPTLPQFGPDTLAPTPIAYVLYPIGTAAARPITIVARAQRTTPTAALTAALREAVRELDADLPLYSVQTFDDVVERTRFSVRLIGSMFWLLAIIAVVLATVGLYALTAYGVTQRTQEIGVRLALGAATSGIVWLFVRTTLLQLAIGLALGLAGALATGRLLESWLTRVASRDPITLTAVAALLVAVSLAARVLPARRAARIDPMVALRYE